MRELATKEVECWVQPIGPLGWLWMRSSGLGLMVRAFQDFSSRYSEGFH